MATVNVPIPFESLVTAVTSLSMEDQHQLLDILEERLFEAEEELEDSLEVLAEVKAAKQAYYAGDYQTLDEYLASRSD